MNNFQRIKLILISLGIDEHQISPYSHLYNDIGLEFQTFHLFIARIEAYFNIDVDVNMHKIETIDQLLNVVMWGVYIRDILYHS